MSLLVLDSAYVQETAPVKYVAFWKCHIVLICLLERRRKKNCMTAWIGPATPFQTADWRTSWRGFCLILAGGTREIKSKVKNTLNTSFITCRQGLILMLSFGLIVARFNPETRASAYPLWRISCSVIYSGIQVKNCEWQHGVGPLYNKKSSCL